MSDQDPRNSSPLRDIFLRLCRYFEHHAGESTILLGSAPFSRRNPGGIQGPPTSLPVPLTSLEDLQLDGYFKYPYAAKALCIKKHPCLLRDSNPGQTAPYSASLTTIPGGRRIIRNKIPPKMRMPMNFFVTT
ncbi:uncharacterized protein TNCV_4408991 [Trichonephila clavipes]|nr:uncharacterized protein TNCV_4408991 [Trichonephila clavipes]